VFEVEDEGNGFDHRKISAAVRNNIIQTDENRGKGITMAYGIFDEISYNEKGNKVTLTKIINSSTR
ncbi:MAG TPA: ATP-binding protein, partial [Spirochaetota bacterium]|nr:ATP-binding protein [Spirochaetota bacterium]